jgi:hypothetical protein
MNYYSKLKRTFLDFMKIFSLVSYKLYVLFLVFDENVQTYFLINCGNVVKYEAMHTGIQ